jgi:2-octaprenyl-6-methoxyphenol hydroxylase
MVSALCIAALGQDVTLVGPAPKVGRHADRRTAALFTGSIQLLRNLSVWPAIEAACARLSGIRLIEDRGALLTAPEVVFTADEVGLEVFGWNVPNADLTAALWQRVTAPSNSKRSRGSVHVVEQAVERIDVCQKHVELGLSGGDTLTARLVVGADGRGSLCRQAAGIGTTTKTYPQQALTCTFQHSRPHHDISTEFHRSAGPLTVVPLPDNASSLVWVETPSEATRLMALDDANFLQELEQRLQGLLGEVSGLTSRNTFPLVSLQAESFAENRIALVGEAAHVMPPIGAQGLNLGLRDCAVLADCVAEAVTTQGQNVDPGGGALCAAYNRQRQSDVQRRLTGVDLLNRSLITDLLPAHLARGFGLHVISHLAPIRRRLVSEGLHPRAIQPSLMQEHSRRTPEQTVPAGS